MADSRTKGASFERDLVKRLNTFFAEHGFDFECKRNLDQYQSVGQCDIEIPDHAIEAKSYKSGWWYAVNPSWERDNAQTVVMTLPQWLEILKRTWSET